MTKKQKQNPKKDIKTVLESAPWAFKRIFKLAPVDAILMLVATTVGSLLPTVSSYFSAQFIDELIRVASEDITKLSEIPLNSPIYIVMLLSATSIFITTLARSAERLLSTKFRVYHMAKFSEELNIKISSLDIQQFEDSDVSDAIKKASEKSFSVFNFWRELVNFIARIVSIVVTFVIAFQFSPFLAVLIIALTIPNNIINAYYTKRLWDFFSDTVETSRKWWWTSSRLTSESAQPEQKISNSNRYISKLVSSLGEKLYGREMKIHRSNIKLSLLATLIGIINYIIAPVYLIAQILQGNITVGQFTFYEGRFITLSRDADYVLGQILVLFDFAYYSSFVKNIFDMKPVIESGTEKLDAGSPPKIEFKNVSFKYPKSKKFALKNISLTITPGEEIAIVGENGAGKTTLIKLILRFYDATEGKILVNGTPIQELSLESYYDLIGALFQEYNTYPELKLKQNIHIGDTASKPSMDRIKSAARQADADKFIEELEQGYDQILSKRFTGGTRLSTGQWQKLALARMFYRDRPVLILDEPTASIDAEAEHKIFKRIYKFMKKKTVIIISHRFSTVRNAGKVYVLSRGELVEQGSHEELMELGGKYARAFKLQAKGYTRESKSN